MFTVLSAGFWPCQMSEQCGGKCYNDWEMSKYLDPVNSNFKCPFLDVRMRNPGCLPTTELCQGLDICGEVHICNENNLRCPKDWSASRFFDVQNLLYLLDVHFL